MNLGDQRDRSVLCSSSIPVQTPPAQLVWLTLSAVASLILLQPSSSSSPPRLAPFKIKASILYSATRIYDQPCLLPPTSAKSNRRWKRLEAHALYHAAHNVAGSRSPSS